TLAPEVKDNPIGTADLLIRDPQIFDKYGAVHHGVSGSEMEAGGCIKACDYRANRKPWMVIRGVSDFGDEFKNDQFHHLASSAAASCLKLFLEEGFDSSLVRPRLTPSPPSTSTILGSTGAVTLTPISQSVLNILTKE